MFSLKTYRDLFSQYSFTKQLMQKDVSESLLTKKHQTHHQSDSATENTARVTFNYLKQIFSERLIRADLWPNRSLSITLLDFFLF